MKTTMIMLRTRRKIITLVCSLTILLLVLGIFFDLPYLFLNKFLNISINHPDIFAPKVNKIAVMAILILSISYVIFIIGYQDTYNFFAKKTTLLFHYLLPFFSFNVYFLLGIVYYVVLSVVSVTHYDLGIDEAWFLHYASNFASSFVSYFVHNENLSVINYLAMFPHELAYWLVFSIFDISVVSVKVLSVTMATFSLAIIIMLFRRHSNTIIGIMSFMFIILQPGFGFVYSSFFGEIMSVAFLLLGVHYLFNKEKEIIAALLFALAIQTKFQALPILIPTLSILFLYYYDRRIIKATIFTGLFMLLLITIRAVPVLVHDSSLWIQLLKQFFNLGGYHEGGSIFIVLDRMQLFNRMLPMLITLFITVAAYPLMKTKFEKFIYFYTILSIVYWIVFFRFVTYRHLFMGIITFMYLLSTVLYHYFEGNNFNKLVYRGLIIIGLGIYFLFGVSTNLIDARIGYNDGVQFNLDGFHSRLFEPVEHDNSQKVFYETVKKMINEDDLVFAQSNHVPKFYLSNPIYTFHKFHDFSHDYRGKYFIISRAAFPGNTKLGFELLRQLDINTKLVLTVGEFYLLTLTDE